VRPSIDARVMEHPTRRRAIATVLALFLAVESVSAVAAAATTRGITHQVPADPPAAQVLAVEAAYELAAPAAPAAPSSPSRLARIVLEPFMAPVGAAAPAKADTSKADGKSKKASAKGTAKATSKPKPRAKAKATSGHTRRTRSYSGSNHVWIPSLGISRSIHWFPCDRSRAPDNYVYRWGCAGANNVYLMGHASSVMKPLHDAYVSGRLRTGMKAIYADSKGRVRTYAVKWWKVVRPTTSASWAWAAQSRPSMTLQTCVGRNSAYRLMVRLVQVRG
jgi:hypothetical protein